MTIQEFEALSIRKGDCITFDRFINGKTVNYVQEIKKVDYFSDRINGIRVEDLTYVTAIEILHNKELLKKLSQQKSEDEIAERAMTRDPYTRKVVVEVQGMTFDRLPINKPVFGYHIRQKTWIMIKCGEIGGRRYYEVGSRRYKRGELNEMFSHYIIIGDEIFTEE